MLIAVFITEMVILHKYGFIIIIIIIIIVIVIIITITIIIIIIIITFYTINSVIIINYYVLHLKICACHKGVGWCTTMHNPDLSRTFLAPK